MRMSNAKLFNRDDNKYAIISDNGNKVTYLELKNKAKELNKIIDEKDLVFIFCDYSLATVSFYYMVMACNAVVMLLDKNMDTEEKNKIIKNYEPQFIWGISNKDRECIDVFYREITELDMILKDNEHILWKTNYIEYKKNSKVSLLLSTSGSTGDSKYVRLSYENLYHNASSLANFIAASNEDSYITTMPMNFIMSLTFCHVHWLVGGTVLVTDESIFNKKFWDFYNKYRITAMVGVPFLFEMLKKTNFFEKDNRNLRYMVIGGGKVSENLQKFLASKLLSQNINLYLAYGQTEGGGALTLIPPNKILKKIGSIGIPIDGMKPYLNEVDSDGIGKLMFQGNSVSLGYAQCKEDLILGDINLKRLDTEDMAYFDKDGYIFLVGRKKRMIKILGVRVSLDIIESRLKDIYEDIDIVCSGEDDLLKIFVNQKCDEAHIVNYVSQKFNINKAMIKICFIKTIPRNESGKVLYNKLECVL